MRSQRLPGVLLLLLAGVVVPGAVAAQSGLTFPGSTGVGNASPAVAVMLTAQTAGTVSSVTALTSGIAGLDFAVSDPGSCAVNTALAVGQSCTLNVIFSPRLPGVRQGAVLLQDGSGVLLASGRLSGIGMGGLPVLSPGEINTVAGDDQWVYQRDGLAATSSSIFLPAGLAVDASGNLFLSDSSNNRVRRVDASTGLISTVAGTGTAGAAGDGGAATLAEVNNPSGLVLDGAGNLYIADTGNHTVRRIDALSGLIVTVAGTPGVSGYAGDGGAARAARLTSPQALALTPGGDLVIADTGNNVVRLLALSTGIIETVAGTGVPGYAGDGGSATTAQLNEPRGVAVRFDGAIAIADLQNQRVRLVDLAGEISTVAGTGTRSFSGDNQPATQAELNGPAAVAFDPAGDLIIADSGNNRVRGVFGPSADIVTLAGNSSSEFGGDGGPASQASLYGPYAVLFDAQGNIWVSDMFHNRVREISGSVLGIPYPTMKVGKTSAPMPEAMYNAGNHDLTLAAPVLHEGALDPGTTTCGQAALAPMAFCSMGVEFAPTEVGTVVTGSIGWPSDAPNVTPLLQLTGKVLSVEPTSVALAANLTPGLLGQPLTLTATVTSADTGRTGTVNFVEGGTTWCPGVVLGGDGTAACTIPSLSLGSHTLTATYSGDDNNAASQSSPYNEVVKQQPALALAANTPAVVTSTVTLTVHVTDQSGVPTGTVVFFDGTTALTTVTLTASGSTSASASWSTQNLGVGPHSLSAQYGGDGANVNGTAAFSEQINQASTLTDLASSNSNVSVGTAVMLTATVESSNGPAPTGSVQFTDGTGSGAPVLGTAALTGSPGTATITISTLAPGSHNLIAAYMGDTNHAVSSSTALSETVQPIATATSLGADTNPLDAGATLHLTAIVSLAQGATADGPLTGMVTFRDGAGGTVLGVSPINATGQAMLAVNSLGVGSHMITASYNGATDYATSTSAVLNETVQQTCNAGEPEFRFGDHAGGQAGELYRRRYKRDRCADR